MTASTMTSSTMSPATMTPLTNFIALVGRILLGFLFVLGGYNKLFGGTAVDSPWVWVLDPIDGTLNYAAGSPMAAAWPQR